MCRVLDYPESSATFSLVRNLDPFLTTNMDVFSDVLFVLVCNMCTHLREKGLGTLLIIMVLQKKGLGRNCQYAQMLKLWQVHCPILISLKEDITLLCVPIFTSLSWPFRLVVHGS